MNNKKIIEEDILNELRQSKTYSRAINFALQKQQAEIIEIIRKHKINVDDNYWCSRKKDFENHKCCGQDGADISFTKESYEEIWDKLLTIIQGKVPKPETKRSGVKG